VSLIGQKLEMRGLAVELAALKTKAVAKNLIILVFINKFLPKAEK